MHASYTQGNFVVLVTCHVCVMLANCLKLECAISSKLLSDMVLHVTSNKGAHSHTHMHTHTCTHTHTHYTYTHTHTHTRTLHIHTHTQSTHTHTHTHTNTLHIHTHNATYTNTHTHNIHEHTHTHTHSRPLAVGVVYTLSVILEYHIIACHRQKVSKLHSYIHYRMLAIVFTLKNTHNYGFINEKGSENCRGFPTH